MAKKKLEENQASPEMMKFFDNLLDLQEYVEMKCEDFENESAVLNQVKTKLSKIIKAKGKK